MATKIERPPQEEWERHKNVILTLASHNPWSTVMEKMKEEYGFVATRDHYDAQTRAWGAHKNLKQNEWQSVLRKFDQLSNLYQRKVRIRILDKVVPDDKVSRSRRRYLRGEEGNVSTANLVPVPRHVSFEVMEVDGQWSTCSLHEDESYQHQEIMPDHYAGHEAGPSNSNLTGEYTMGGIPDDQASILPDSMILPADEGTIPFLYASVDTHNTTLGTDQTLYFNHPQDWNSGAVSPNGSLSKPYVQLLTNLPFEQLNDNIRINGAHLSNAGPSRQMQESDDGLQSVSAFFTAMDISADGSTTMTKRAIRTETLDQNPWLRSLKSLLPGQIETSLISEDDIFGTNFMRSLVYSIVNGYTGLEGISIAKLLRFLGQQNAGVLFYHMLQSNPNYVAKALAENLLKAAIEAEEAHVVRQLLDTRLVSIDEVVWEGHQGPKRSVLRMTALERVAVLQHFKLLEMLLDYNPDVNKTFIARSSVEDIPGGVLGRLLQTIRRGETVPDALLSVAQRLLRIGAQVAPAHLTHLVQRTHSTELIDCVFSQLTETDHESLCKGGSLSKMFEFSEASETATRIGYVVGFCMSIHGCQCFENNPDMVDKLLVTAALRRHLDSVLILLPLARKGLSRVLSASIHGGSRAIIDEVLAQGARVDGPASAIEDPPNRQRSLGHPLAWANSYPNRTTPLAEALKAQNEDFIALCEREGAFECLEVEGHFQAALKAAASVGNTHYVKKIFEKYPALKSVDMKSALSEAIRCNHAEIASLLIQKGGSLCGDDYEMVSLGPLQAAVERRNEGLVAQLLGYPFGRYLRTELDPIYSEAIRWGNRSVLLDLVYAFPGEICHRMYDDDKRRLDEFHLTEDYLRFLLDSNVVTVYWITDVAETMLVKGDFSMIDFLIELGVSVEGSQLLPLATQLHPELLEPLLQRMNLRRRRPYGLSAVCTAIKLGLAGIGALDILLSSGKVDFKSFEYLSSMPEPLKMNGKVYTPLGLALTEAKNSKAGYLIVQRLLRAGCDPGSLVLARDGPNSSNMTALLAAIDSADLSIVKLLIDSGAPVNTEAARGVCRTPLQRAAELGSLEIVRLLLKSGADVNALPAPYAGGTALQFAAMSGNCNIAAELMEAGADPYECPLPLHGRWPLEGAAEYGRLDMIDYLFKILQFKRPDIDQCRSAMNYASGNGHMGCRDLIVERAEEIYGAGCLSGD